ncbi:DnaD domain protein [Apilactobacillus ozensis]|uniref:DnaD domain protein n=1 Tax=Apilactobacillus ozensis TaxID=866801 RepID=UPI0006CF28EC|nr:DnaD domain protein [Apilactobacillus ozensis]
MLLKKIRSSLSDDNNTKHKIVNDVKDFDFNLLLDILSQSYVNLDSVKKSHDLILSEHLLYGIDEISTSKFVEKATNINTNNLDVNKFKLLVSRQFDNVKLNKVPKKASKDETVKLSSVERGLVKSADFYAPIDFLYQLKKLNKGYVSSNEERILRELVHRMILPKEVINMITYHILIDQGNASLNKNLVDTIANDWAKNNISSAAGAIEYIRNRKSTQTKSYKKSFSTHKNSNIKQIKESLPEWARDDYNPRKNNKPIDKNKKRQLELELEELDNNK